MGLGYSISSCGLCVSIEGRGRRLTVIGGGRQSWNDIFQSYGLMAMRSEQHGNVFAKLNNGNLSACAGWG
jgi:hypothetical protein